MCFWFISLRYFCRISVFRNPRMKSHISCRSTVSTALARKPWLTVYRAHSGADDARDASCSAAGGTQECVLWAVPTLAAHPRLLPTTWPSARSGYEKMPGLAPVQIRTRMAQVAAPPVARKSVAPFCFSFNARSACSGGRPLPKGAGCPGPTDLAARQQPTERGRVCTSTPTERRNKPNTANRPPPRSTNPRA